MKRKRIDWMAQSYFCFPRLPDDSGVERSYYVTLTFAANADWLYTIDEARRGTSPYYLEIAKGNGGRDLRAAKAHALRMLKKLHKERCAKCVDCGGYATVGTIDCQRCREQWAAEREVALATAENEGMIAGAGVNNK